jgi:hypothetical protein
MAASTHTAEQEPIFGVIQGFSLGTLLLLSPLLAVMLDKFQLIDMVSKTVPAASLGTFSGILWLVEAAVYAIIAGVMARHVLIALAGPVLGVMLRFIISLLIGVIISTQNTQELDKTLQGMDGASWGFRLLAILMTCAIFFFPLRRLFQTGFGMMAGPAAPVNSSRSKQFSFANKAPRTGHYQIVRSSTPAPSATAAAPSATPSTAPSASRHSVLTPPENFVPVIPRDNVFGTVSVPAAVVLASVPEAAPFLEADKPVTIHLAYLVPQLSRCTAWLLWQQIFSAPGGGGARALGEQADAGVRDRWVKISPKFFITQVPQEYYQMQRIPPAWMRLAEVPQESQFNNEE